LQTGPAPLTWSSRNHHQLQVQVKEVMGIMTTNVDKMLERDTKLSELVDRAEALRSKASQFVTQGSRVKRTFWWRNCRSRAVLVVIGVIVVVIVIVGIWFGTVSGP
uniref:V-SNARE coiled-coil homology domain-containing protein n=1 Tax=Cynoglossus semilaevis TaxID=244447 RepID=A0A3P8VBT1_CYNSE